MSTDHKDNRSNHLASGLAKIGLVLRHEAWQRAGKDGVTPTQGQILALLANRFPGGAQVSELAREIAVSTPTVSDAVNSLVAKKYVRKTRSSEDARVVRVVLTAVGTKASGTFMAWPDELLRGIDELSLDEQGIMLRVMVKLLHNLEINGRIPLVRMCPTCVYFQPGNQETEKAHFCTLLNSSIGDRDLRLDCSEQQPDSPEKRAANFHEFLRAGSQP